MDCLDFQMCPLLFGVDKYIPPTITIPALTVLNELPCSEQINDCHVSMFLDKNKQVGVLVVVVTVAKAPH